ncbi:MAG: ketosteroid isomerase-like enzyme [Amycolatopsis sp.]|nr:ketosteroid isomerase-like enzyme [Amycolatopsis sp.]
MDFSSAGSQTGFMTQNRERATEPEALARLFAQRANAGDAEGLAALYEEDAVLAYPPGSATVGREAILKVLEEMLKHLSDFKVEEALPTVYHGDLALTSTKSADNTGGRTQVVRRQPDGSWLRIIDRPEIRG